MNEALIVGLVTIAIGLIEVIKGIIKKFGESKSVLTETERAQLKDLWDWHSKEDSDGVKVWYIRQSLADAITAFASSVEAQTRALEAISNKLNSIDGKLDDIKDD